jgi:sugar phosphate permease
MSYTKDKDTDNMPVVHHVSDRTSTPSLAMGQASGRIEFTAEEEKALLRKVDMRLIPSVFLMYLLSYLDRSNIGNAYTAGMGRDLNMTSNDYSIVLLVFFIR